MVEMTLKKKRSYIHSLVGIVLDPRRFYAELLSGGTSVAEALWFAVLGSLACAAGMLLTGSQTNPVLMGGIFLVNALGIMLISSVLGYITMVMFMGKRATYRTLFLIYAYASGVTLLFSWVIQFIWFTEIWKWWLVYTGFRNTAAFTGRQALFVIAGSLTAQFLFLYSMARAFSG